MASLATGAGKRALYGAGFAERVLLNILAVYV